MVDHFSQFMEKLKLKQLDENQNLFFIQEKIGVKPSSFLVAIGIFVVIVALTSNATNIVVGLVCCLIPGFFTFLALQHLNRDYQVKYLTYWIIFTLIETISPFLSMILSSMLYIMLRVGITVALLHPSLNLTVYIYRTYIQPQFKRYESSIDKQIQKGKTLADDQYKRFSRK